MSASYPLKAHSLEEIEKAIAKSLEELTGQPFVANISNFVVEEVSTAAAFLGKSRPVSMQITVKPFVEGKPSSSEGIPF